MNTKNLPIAKRLKELRKEKNLKQNELAEQMGMDNKMISHYENGKSIPSIDALMKIAVIFDISVDYLLFEESPRRPLKQSGDRELIEYVSNMDKLTEEDRDSIKHIIKSLIVKNKVKSFMSDVD
ncbi:MAG: helix-turn-helix transcriptional regulator [bacterium]|nr:helix-turn-helix transcriptional regulator [bacterium]